MPDDSELLSRLAEEYLSRARSGPPPDVEEFAARHPRLAGRLRELLPKLLDPTVTVAGEEPPPPRPPAPGLTPGTVFGAYRVRRKVGEGGMGVVYEADHLTLDRRVALKVLPAGVLRGGDRLERFLREARTAAGLHHTNIVPIFEVGEVEGTPYFAMQFIDGRGLDQFPPGAVPLPDPQRTAEFRPGAPTPPPPPPAGSSLRGDRYRFVAKVGAQAADALAYAHRRGVVHRDIKPSNLLLDDSGTVWVADFGLARRADDVTLTRSGMLIGTPRYMSPEQADLGGKPVDHRTDVYSLGVTLYELLTGRPPFDGRSSNELLIRILHGEPVPPSRIDPAVPRDLETVILKAMAKRPEDRYPGAEELAADFRRFLNREPVRARRIGPLGRAWRWALRSPAVAGLLAAVVLSLAGGTAAATLLALEARDRQRIAERFAKQAAANETRALEEAGRARTERRRALANLYVAQANLAQTDLREFRTDSLLRRLGEMRPGPGEPDFRGFEWNYLWRAANGADRFRDFRDGSSLYLVALSGDGRRWVRLGGRGAADGAGRRHRRGGFRGPRHPPGLRPRRAAGGAEPRRQPAGGDHAGGGRRLGRRALRAAGHVPDGEPGRFRDLRAGGPAAGAGRAVGRGTRLGPRRRPGGEGVPAAGRVLPVALFPARRAGGGRGAGRARVRAGDRGARRGVGGRRERAAGGDPAAGGAAARPVGAGLLPGRPVPGRAAGGGVAGAVGPGGGPRRADPARPAAAVRTGRLLPGRPACGG
ncbi:MAG TPA: serine/threonine-protein kinase, partial [Gemmataceae bacterium]